jgi:mannose-6-phosphate isomerase
MVRHAPAEPDEPMIELLPDAAQPYFRAQRIAVTGRPARLEPSFAILVVLEGRLTLWSDRAESIELAGGDTALVPYGAGATALEGHADVIRCQPPAPDAEAGRW